MSTPGVMTAVLLLLLPAAGESGDMLLSITARLDASLSE